MRPRRHDYVVVPNLACHMPHVMRYQSCMEHSCIEVRVGGISRESEGELSAHRPSANTVWRCLGVIGRGFTAFAKFGHVDPYPVVAPPTWSWRSAFGDPCPFPLAGATPSRPIRPFFGLARSGSAVSGSAAPRFRAASPPSCFRRLRRLMLCGFAAAVLSPSRLAIG